MQRIEDECVGCTDIGLYCLGDTCPNRNVIRYYCDYCGEEEKLYYYDNHEICKECLLKNFEVVNGSNW